MTRNVTTVAQWKDLAGAAPPAWLQLGVAKVFREAATRWPADPAAAAEFTELWLDGYLREDPGLALVALDPAASPGDHPRVVGYLVASMADPLTDPRFASLAYFRRFAPELAAYPAHLHLNVAAGRRNQGIGERLIEEICAILAALDCPGVHVVTAAGARNVGFYDRNHFVERARTAHAGRDLVLMGRTLQT